ncbi:MAG TPA: hypothetical protein VFK90_08875, partial [Anaeromyxobacter sp.]|nr:hypothetical protein [Anaeromyxobacter sp.]
MSELTAALAVALVVAMAALAVRRIRELGDEVRELGDRVRELSARLEATEQDAASALAQADVA